MDKLSVFKEQGSSIFSTNDLSEIISSLAEVGVYFARWSTETKVSESDSNEQILKAYNSQIQELITQKGYQAVDVISLSSNHPDKIDLRKKFLSEHTHSEDEVRFFVRGQGLFTLHIGEKVFSVRCEQGDLISVPADTPHWFDMGENPQFTCIRLFNNPEGWVAKYTGSRISEKFSYLET